MKQAMEVLSMISQTDLEREYYLERERVERDELSRNEEYRNAQEKMSTAQEQARTAQEQARTARIKGIRLCQRLLELPLSTDDDLALLSLDELDSVAEAAEPRLISRKP